MRYRICRLIPWSIALAAGACGGETSTHADVHTDAHPDTGSDAKAPNIDAGTGGSGGSALGGAGTSKIDAASTAGNGGSVQSGGTGGASGAGAATQGGSSGTSGSGGSGGSGGIGGGCVVRVCPDDGAVRACGDCVDNDRDGLVDTTDPDCKDPCGPGECSGFPAMFQCGSSQCGAGPCYSLGEGNWCCYDEK
jgi:hypothetical protein